MISQKIKYEITTLPLIAITTAVRTRHYLTYCRKNIRRRRCHKYDTLNDKKTIRLLLTGNKIHQNKTLSYIFAL